MDSPSRKYAGSMAGFTLARLLAVVFVVATTPLILWPHVTVRPVRDPARSDIWTLSLYVQIFKVEHDRLPETLDELVHPPSGRPYLDRGRVPHDPWGNEYIYTLDEEKQFEILCYGADGVPGGAGPNQDISSKHLPKKEYRYYWHWKPWESVIE